MDITPGLQLGWTVVYVEAVWHASTKLSHEERISQPRSKRNCRLECGSWKAPSTEGNSGHCRRRRSDNIDSHYSVAVTIGPHAFWEAIDYYSLPHDMLLSSCFEARKCRPQIRHGECIRMEATSKNLDPQELLT